MADLVPFDVLGFILGNSDTRESCRVEWNDAVVSDLKLNRSLRRDSARQAHDSFGQRACVIDIGCVLMRLELKRLSAGLN